MYEFLQPETLEQALELLRDKNSLRILAGGTDLIIALKDKLVACDYLMDCKKIPELRALAAGNDGLSIGAAVSLNRLLDSGLLTGPYEALRQGADELANTLLRNRATLAGNICNASPGGDMLPPSLVLGGWVETVSPAGGRSVPLKEFFTGVKKHVLEPNELIVTVRFPKLEGRSAYRKRKRIRGHDLSQVGVAAFYGRDGSLKLAYGAVGPTPVLLEDFGPCTPTQLAERKESILNRVTDSIHPISDVRSTKEYRLDMARYLTGQLLDEFTCDKEVGA